MSVTETDTDIVPGVPVIVTAADDLYAMPLAVLLRSIEQNVNSWPQVYVYILDGGISHRSRRKVLRSLCSDKLIVRWIPVKRYRVAGLPVSGHIRSSAYNRILIPELLPETVGKALYLDADIIVRHDLQELWEMPFLEKPLLAVQEGDKVLSAECGVRSYRELGLPADAKYLNSGVLLINLDVWRQEGIQAKILNYLSGYHHNVNLHDQDGINAVLAMRWGELDRCWNYRVDCFIPPVSDDIFLSEMNEKAKIVHFASAVKPWHYGVRHPSTRLFYEYLGRTAWKRWRPKRPMSVWFNKYFWAQKVRNLPVLGSLWSSLRQKCRRMP